MRHHCIFKSEKVSRSRCSQMLRLVDLVPDVINIFIEDTLIFLKVSSTIIEISQYEEKLFGGLLFEQLQVDLEDDLQQSIVRCPMSTDICRPHIDEKHIRNCEGKQWCCLLESLHRDMPKFSLMFFRMNLNLPCAAHLSPYYPYPRCRTQGFSHPHCDPTISPWWSTASQLPHSWCRTLCRITDLRACFFHLIDIQSQRPCGNRCLFGSCLGLWAIAQTSYYSGRKYGEVRNLRGWLTCTRDHPWWLISPCCVQPCCCLMR